MRVLMADRCSSAGRSILLPLLAVTIAVALLGCGTEGPKDGGFCSHCGEANAPSCSNSAVISDQDLVFFCGDAPRTECNVCTLQPGKGYICTIPLICAHEDNLAARRCYPTVFGDSKTPLSSYECEGLKPGSTS